MNIRCISVTLWFTALTVFSPVGANELPKNVLLIIADDMGAEKLGCYGLADYTPVTPNLDRLCDEGVKYTRVWSQPSCSPTRVSMMTGRYGFRTGSLAPTGPVPNFTRVEGEPNFVINNKIVASLIKSGDYIPKPNSPLHYMTSGQKLPYKIKFGKGLGLDETTLPQLLKVHADYQTAAIGKWHMADDSNGLQNHPNTAGFDHFIGSMTVVENYYRYTKVAQGEEIGFNEAYATTETVNDAIDWLRESDEDAPWFMWLALSAPHDPFQKPPNDLISAESQKLDEKGVNPKNAHLYYDAMIEAMDTEIGRLLEVVQDDTIIIFVGDNGTPQGILAAPYSTDQGKATLYQGGVHVPLIIAGTEKSGRKDKRLAHTTDLFATVLELAGIDVAKIGNEKPIDSRSLFSSKRRKWVFADQKGILPTGVEDGQAIRNKRFKLIVDHITDSVEFYDLKKDPFEASPLELENLSWKERRNFLKLQNEMDAYVQD